MRKRLLSIILIIILSVSVTQTAYASSVSDIQQKKDQKKKEQSNTQGQLDSINDQLNDLAGEREDVGSEIDELDAQLVEIMASVSLLEDEIDDTQVKINVAQRDYDDAKAREEEQYAAMKKRIQYMYERGNTTYMQIFLGSKSFSDMLNKAEYVQELYAYDQKMLKQYVALTEEVAQLKSDLEDKKSELEAAEFELQEEKASLDEMLDEKKAVAADYDRQIAKVQQEAAVYKAQIKQQNEEIKKLEAQEKAKLAEEEAKRKAAEQAKNNSSNNSPSSDSKAVAPASSGGSKTVPPKIGSGTGSDIANYACQFVGNPYVPGGTSLTNGADCSGFTQAVYKVYGYNLPRNSAAQRSAGVGVDYASAQPGDLICYAGHVAIYLGNGRIVHASSVRTGIKYGVATYKEILAVRRIVN